MANATGYTQQQVDHLRSILIPMVRDRTATGRMRWAQNDSFLDFICEEWPSITNRVGFIRAVCAHSGLGWLSAGGSDGLLYRGLTTTGNGRSKIRTVPVQSNTSERIASYIDRFVAQYPSRSDEHIARMAQVALRVNL